MSAVAGYAAVLGINQTVMQDMARLSYLADAIPRFIYADTEIPGTLSFHTSLFADCPTISLSSARELKITIDMEAWGPMSIGIGTGSGPVPTPETRNVRFTARILVAHALTIQGGSLIFGMETESAIVDAYSISVLNGNDYSPGVRAFLDGPIFAAILQMEIRTNLGAFEDGFPNLPLAFLDTVLGDVLTGPPGGPPHLLTPTGRCRDCVLVIGLDLVAGSARTNGDPNALLDRTDGFGLSLWVNPDLWLPATTDQLLDGTNEAPGVRQQVADQGASLDMFVLSLQEGYLRVDGAASTEGGSVLFDFKTVPHLVRPAVYKDLGEDEDGQRAVLRAPEREELWFEVIDIHIDVVEDWWVVVLEAISSVLTLGIAGLVIRTVIGMIHDDIEAAIREHGTSGGDRVYQFQFSAATPAVIVKIDGFEFHREGVFLGMSVTTQFPSPAIVGPRYVDVDDALRDAPPTYACQLPATVHPEDPYLNVRWTARSIDDNTLLANIDNVAAINSQLVIGAFNNAARIQVACRVYRTLGSEVTDFFNQSITLVVADRLDRQHRYVRWFHYACAPVVVVLADGSRDILGGEIQFRASRIHRTDFPGRCRMAGRYSLHTPRGFRPPASMPPHLEYLDTLPFPIADLAAHRDDVCEYCFFGGPGNPELVPLPS